MDLRPLELKKNSTGPGHRPGSFNPDDKVMTHEAAKDLTIRIVRIVLEEQNGYSKEEIIKGNLAENCEWTDLYDSIFDLLDNYAI